MQEEKRNLPDQFKGNLSWKQGEIILYIFQLKLNHHLRTGMGSLPMRHHRKASGTDHKSERLAFLFFSIYYDCLLWAFLVCP